MTFLWAVALSGSDVSRAVGSLLEALNATGGLWTALTAIAAVAAAIAAITANQRTTKALLDARENERPSLSTADVKIRNRQGGFEVDLGIRNYGVLPAQNHHIKVWRCDGDSILTLRATSSANAIAPTEAVVFMVDCDNYTPSGPTFLVFQLTYEDDRGRKFQTWLYYNWPVMQHGTLRAKAADIKPALALKSKLSGASN